MTGRLVIALALASCGKPPSDGIQGEIRRACERNALECLVNPLYSVSGSCQRILSSDFDDAVGYGCGGPYLTLLDCLASAPLDCSLAPEQCATERAAFDRCQGEAEQDTCGGVGEPDGRCSLACNLFEVQCAPSVAGGVSCECVSGDREGVEFDAPNCESGFSSLARAQCQ